MKKRNQTIKTQLVRYLMMHGVLKQADALRMAREILQILK